MKEQLSKEGINPISTKLNRERNNDYDNQYSRQKRGIEPHKYYSSRDSHSRSNSKSKRKDRRYNDEYSKNYQRRNDYEKNKRDNYDDNKRPKYSERRSKSEESDNKAANKEDWDKELIPKQHQAIKPDYQKEPNETKANIEDVSKKIISLNARNNEIRTIPVESFTSGQMDDIKKTEDEKSKQSNLPIVVMKGGKRVIEMKLLRESLTKNVPIKKNDLRALA